MGEVTLTGTLTCESAEDAELVAALLPDHIAATRAEPGCLSFTVERSSDPMTWSVSERFADPAAFHAHQARTRASEWGRLTAHIPRTYTVSGLDEAPVEPTLVTAAWAGERALLAPEVRRDGDRLRALLAPDFVEIGQSARRWSREEIIDALLADDEPAEASVMMSEPKHCLVADDVVVIDYLLDFGARRSRRSSVWCRVDGEVRCAFHQGTAVPPSAGD